MIQKIQRLSPKRRSKHHEVPERYSSVTVQIECGIRAAIRLGEQDEVSEADIAISVDAFSVGINLRRAYYRQ